MVKPVVGIFVAIAIYLLIGYINGYYAVNSLDKEPNMPPLYDKLYTVLPIINRKYPDHLLIAMVVYFFIRWFFTNKVILEHFFIIMTVIFTIRVIAFTVTEEPPPTQDCVKRLPGEKPVGFVNMMKQIFYGRSCSDLMFSGHAAFTVLIMMFTLYYSKNLLEKLIIVSLGILELGLIIAGRLHYSSDVVVGTAITVFAFFSWQHIGLPWLK